jgi:hypothetical protein
MKKKLFLTLSAIILLQLVMFAQNRYPKYSGVKLFISDYEITHIEANQGIDLLFLDGTGEGLSAQVEDESLRKIRIDLASGRLKLSKRPGLAAHERITVYINVNGTHLQSLKLYDDAFATSRGVLSVYDMNVELKDNAKLALRTKGRLNVNIPNHYKLEKEEKYYSVYSTGK